MERGLLWLPLLVLFIGLAWAGWNEFQKVESYRAWAEGFRASKFDIYSVVGLGEDFLVVGKPSRKGPIELKRIGLEQVQTVNLSLDKALVSLEAAQAIIEPPKDPPNGRNNGGKEGPQPKAIAIELDLGGDKLQIPFTQLDLAVDWTKRLKQELIQGDD